MEIVHSINLIVSNPKVRNGRPCIVGTGVRVTDIMMANIFHQQNPDEIAADYSLSLAEVYAAMAYYYEHKTELDEDIQQQIAKARELRENRVGSKAPFLFG